MSSTKAIDATASRISHGKIWTDLAALLGKEQVLTKLIERLAHAGDASIYRMMPQVVLMPRKDEEIQKILEYCRN